MTTPVSYARVARTFWTDPDIKRRLSPEQKELLLYYFTSPHGNMIGLYYVPLDYVALETGLAIDDVENWTARDLEGFVTYDHETEEVLVHRAVVHQVGPELKAGDNRVKAIERILADAHSHRLVQRFLELYAHWPISGPLPRGPEAPSQAPSEAPSKPDAVADAVSVSGTESSSSSGAAAPDPDQLASALIRVANRGMQDNPAIGSAVTPIPTSHGSRQAVLDWLQEGIPASAIEAAVYETAKTYQPDPPRHRQISTMKYFTGPVHDEWGRIQAENTEAPKNGTSTSNGRRSRRSAGDVPQRFDYSDATDEFVGFDEAEPDPEEVSGGHAG